MSYSEFTDGTYAGGSSAEPMSFPESKFQLRYGNITFENLQDIELAIIVMKELKFMLSSHYRCYFDQTTTLGDQIDEFLDTQYHRNVVDPGVKTRLCAVMKGLLYERNQINHTEGIDFLRDRSKFINQSMEVFVNLSPTENGICVSPARHSVLVPCPNSQSLLEDLTFIDYEQYEDISIAVKVTKRIDHILREVFQQHGETLQQKINNFPYDANNIKRKMSQVNAIKNKIVNERYFNNFDNRVEFINLAQSIFANLIEIVDSGKVYKFGNNLNLDILSNTTEDNNMTASVNDATTVSTYHIPAHAPGPATYTYPTSQTLSAPFSPPSAPRSFNNSWATSGNYEKLPSFRDDSTIPMDAETLNMREYHKQAERYPTQAERYPPDRYPPERYLPTHTVPASGTRYEKLPHTVEVVERRLVRVDGRHRRKNRKMASCCKNTCIGVTIALFMVALSVVCWKFLF